MIESAGINAPVTFTAVGNDGLIRIIDGFAGYWVQSANLEQGSNTILVADDVFATLKDAAVGDQIVVTDQYGVVYTYAIVESTIFDMDVQAEANRTLDYIVMTSTPRLTLVTFDPPGTREDRLIVVATPVE